MPRKTNTKPVKLQERDRAVSLAIANIEQQLRDDPTSQDQTTGMSGTLTLTYSPATTSRARQPQPVAELPSEPLLELPSEGDLPDDSPLLQPGGPPEEAIPTGEDDEETMAGSTEEDEDQQQEQPSTEVPPASQATVQGTQRIPITTPMETTPPRHRPEEEAYQQALAGGDTNRILRMMWTSPQNPVRTGNIQVLYRWLGMSMEALLNQGLEEALQRDCIDWYDLAWRFHLTAIPPRVFDGTRSLAMATIAVTKARHGIVRPVTGMMHFQLRTEDGQQFVELPHPGGAAVAGRQPFLPREENRLYHLHLPEGQPYEEEVIQVMPREAIEWANSKDGHCIRPIIEYHLELKETDMRTSAARAFISRQTVLTSVGEGISIGGIVSEFLGHVRQGAIGTVRILMNHLAAARLTPELTALTVERRTMLGAGPAIIHLREREERRE